MSVQSTLTVEMLAPILVFWLLTVGIRAFEDESGPDSLHRIFLTSHRASKGRVAAFRKGMTTPINVPLDDYYNGTDLQ